jgi:hypothetical protein
MHAYLPTGLIGIISRCGGFCVRRNAISVINPIVGSSAAQVSQQKKVSGAIRAIISSA